MAFFGRYGRLQFELLVLDRETEFECCSQSFLARYMHFTLMALDELVGLQQADTRSGDAEIDGIVSTEKAFEKLFLIIA